MARVSKGQRCLHPSVTVRRIERPCGVVKTGARRSVARVKKKVPPGEKARRQLLNGPLPPAMDSSRHDRAAVGWSQEMGVNFESAARTVSSTDSGAKVRTADPTGCQVWCRGIVLVGSAMRTVRSLRPVLVARSAQQWTLHLVSPASLPGPGCSVRAADPTGSQVRAWSFLSQSRAVFTMKSRSS